MDSFEIELSAETTKQLFDLCNNMDLTDTVALIVNGERFVKVKGELEDIKAEMCDDYCCKRKEWKGDPDDFIETICTECPLSRL